MNYIKGFHGLRAISIGLVILTHLDLLTRLPSNAFIQDRFWHLISGETGVNLFFVLSGFLITTILLNEKAKTGKIKILNFFARRFIRLLPPLILFYAMIITIAFLGLIPIPTEAILYAIFYVYNFVPNQLYVYELGHIWSLSVEEQYYITWPFVILLANKFWKITLVFLLVIGTSILALMFFPTMTAFENYRPLRFFIPAIAPIILGSFSAVLNLNFRQRMKQLSVKKFLFPVAFIVLYCFPLYAPQPLSEVIHIIQSAGFCFLILWIVYHQESLTIKLLEFSLVKYIGTISYGLYVFQGLFLRTGGGGESWIHHFPYNALLALVCAILSYELIEKRTLKWKNRFSEQ